MLDDFKEKQPVTYDILMNEINDNHVSHAYLFDENNNPYAFKIVMAFVKEILCHNIDNDHDKEVLCKRIDDGNYPEIKIIEPDGMFIKKEQILGLQQEFSMVAVEGSKRIYIIKDADKMRKEAANSMLKFLEEPDNDIMAIMMTNNFNNLLSTIVSRCQVIRLNNDGDIDNNDNELDELVISFIKSVNNQGIRTIINIQDLIFSKINNKDREAFVRFFDKMIEIYYDIMKIITKNTNIKYNDYKDDLDEIASSYSAKRVIEVIDYLIQVKDSVKYNVNLNLLMDSVVINIGG